MKKIKAILVTVLALTSFWGCKSTGEPDLTPQSDYKIQSVLSIQTISEQRLAYRLLENDEVAHLWNSRLNAILSSGIFNNAQKSLIGELRGFIYADAFKLDNRNRLTAFRDAWLAKASKVLTPAQIKTIAFTIGSNADVVKALKTPQVSLVDKEDNKCECNISSLFTCDDDKPECHSVWPFGCDNATTSGCGFLWSYPCNGRCFTQ